MSSVADELSSHYVLFSCEGTAEGVVVERLYESGDLVIPVERVVKDPLTFRPFTRLRRASDIEARFFGQNYSVDGAQGLMIARVVDSRSARFSLSRANSGSVLVRSS